MQFLGHYLLYNHLQNERESFVKPCASTVCSNATKLLRSYCFPVVSVRTVARQHNKCTYVASTTLLHIYFHSNTQAESARCVIISRMYSTWLSAIWLTQSCHFLPSPSTLSRSWKESSYLWTMHLAEPKTRENKGYQELHYTILTSHHTVVHTNGQ